MNTRSKFPSTEEVVAMIKRSHWPTLVVEGSSDQTFYQSVEKKSKQTTIDFIAVGGKRAVLAIYKKRHEFKVPVVFVADRDVWVFFRKPKGLEELVVTNGYSIENDILNETQIRQGLSSAGISYLDNMKEPLSNWFAYQVGCCKNGQKYSFRCSITGLVDEQFHLTKGILGDNPVIDDKILTDITSHWWKKFRGKTLLDLCFRATRKDPKHARITKKEYIHNVMLLPDSPARITLERTIIQRFRKAKKMLSNPLN